jgi:hypothetical protein
VVFFGEFSLCLSRACLGKMLVFISTPKWLKKTAFTHPGRALWERALGDIVRLQACPGKGRGGELSPQCMWCYVSLPVRCVSLFCADRERKERRMHAPSGQREEAHAGLGLSGLAAVEQLGQVSRSQLGCGLTGMLSWEPSSHSRVWCGEVNSSGIS